MFICDIPPHDMSADFVVMAERRKVQAEMAKKLAVRRAQDCIPPDWMFVKLSSGIMTSRLFSSCQADKLGLEEATQLLQIQQAESELANFK